MRREDCVRGMIVQFGRPHGEKTRAEVVKVNPAKAQLKTLEPRGLNRRVGEVWRVPYSMITPVAEAVVNDVMAQAEQCTSTEELVEYMKSRGYSVTKLQPSA